MLLFTMTGLYQKRSDAVYRKTDRSLKKNNTDYGRFNRTHINYAARAILYEAKQTKVWLNTSSENFLHDRFERLHAHLLIKALGGGVDFPYVQRDMVAADFARERLRKLIQRRGHAFAAVIFVHADIVDVEGFHVRLVVGVAYFLDDKKRVSDGAVVFVRKDENGVCIIAKEREELFVVVFARSVNKKIGPTVGVNGEYLIEKLANGE